MKKQVREIHDMRPLVSQLRRSVRAILQLHEGGLLATQSMSQALQCSRYKSARGTAQKMLIQQDAKNASQ